MSLQDRTANCIDAYQQAKYRDAESGFSECVTIARKSARSPSTLAEALSNLSTAYFALSKFPEARESLKEALSLAPANSESSTLKILRACLLNNQARLFSEMQQLKECEENLLEAIKLAEPMHPVYAAEFHANFLRVLSSAPRLRHRLKHHADEFDRLQASGESLQIYLDDLAGWRRPGRHWDVVGQASPEALRARSILNHISPVDGTQSDDSTAYMNILKIDEESKQVPPHLVAVVNLALADNAFVGGDFQTAVAHGENLLRALAGSYLSTQPASATGMLRIAAYFAVGTKLDESRRLLEKAKVLVSQALGSDNPHYAKCLTTETRLMYLFAAGAKETGDALAGYRRAREMIIPFYPDTHSNVIDLNVLIVRALIKANQLPEAESLLIETSRNAQDNKLDTLDKQCKCLNLLVDLRMKQGRTAEVEGTLKLEESLLEKNVGLCPKEKLLELQQIGRRYMDCGLFVEGERVHRQSVTLSASRGDKLYRNAKQQLVFCLVRVGKDAEASKILSTMGDTDFSKTQKPTRCEELLAQSHLAWSLQSQGSSAQAKALATEVLNEAHLLLPDCEEPLVIALSLLMDKARDEAQPDEMLRLISMLSGHEHLFRIRTIVPLLHLETARIYAKQKSIRAEKMFKTAIHYAEIADAIVPGSLDNCVNAFMDYYIAAKNIDSALTLCERLLSLRTTSSGIKSLEYASALNAKASLLAYSDLGLANDLSLEAYNIVNPMSDKAAKFELVFIIRLREMILKDLLMFDESAKLEARKKELQEELKASLPTKLTKGNSG